jgi:hypothetical protein
MFSPMNIIISRRYKRNARYSVHCEQLACSVKPFSSRNTTEQNQQTGKLFRHVPWDFRPHGTRKSLIINHVPDVPFVPWQNNDVQPPEH